MNNEIEFYLEDLKSKFQKIDLDQYYLSYSGGRDSHFLLWFIEFYLGKSVKVYSFNTYMEHTEIMSRMIKHADKIFLPKMKPFEIKEKYGLPTFTKFQDEMISRYQRGNRSENTMNAILRKNKLFILNKKAMELTLSDSLHKVSNKCCKILKKDVGTRIYKSTGLLPIIAVRSSESINRRNAYKSCFTKKKHFTPIFDLTDELLHAIEMQYMIPVPNIYNYIDRTGCMGCPYGRNIKKELDLVGDNRRNFLVKLFYESYKVKGVVE